MINRYGLTDIQIYPLPSDEFTVDWAAMSDDERCDYRTRKGLPVEWSPDYAWGVRQA